MPMTFERLRREAIEVCSPELYQRRAVAMEVVKEAYLCGLTRELTNLFRSRREADRVLHRLVEQAFVRAYLRERRAGVPPREPGVPSGTDVLVDHASRAVTAEYYRVRERRMEAEAEAYRAARATLYPHCGQPMP